MDIMIDIETMGTDQTSAVVAVGAVAIHRGRNEIVDSTFYSTITLASNIEAGRTVTANTIIWWMQQSDEARNEIFNAVDDLKTVMYRLSWWMRSLDVTPVIPWGNSASFDLGILANAMRSVGQEVPWDFRNERCYRTLKNEYPWVGKPEDIGVAHHALCDAIWQAKHLINIKRWINEHARG